MLSKLKIFASYFLDLSIEKIQSQYSGKVEVALSNGQYKLSTEKAIYSFGTNYTSFDVAFKAINIQQQAVKKVLVLGFGLGSVVDLLQGHATISSITAIDADAVIIQLAKKYLQSNLKNKTEFICEDAETFVQQTKQQFDLVLFDVFIEDETPMQFMQQEFLLTLKQLVNKNGILLFSKIDDSNVSKIENAQFETVFATVFAHSFSIDTDGNKVFAWFNKAD